MSEPTLAPWDHWLAFCVTWCVFGATLGPFVGTLCGFNERTAPREEDDSCR